jgi:hypothetical protein
LKNEVKERERDLNNYELREGYEKQTLQRDIKDLKETVSNLTE